MNITVYSYGKTNISPIGIIDEAEVVWTTRYYQNGEFQLYLPATDRNKNLLKEGYLVCRSDDDNVGIIQDVHYTYSKQEGEMMTITGSFSPVLLARRIISEQTQLKGNVQDCIANLIITNVIQPTKTCRIIDSIKLGEFSDEITEILSMQTTGDNLLTKIEEICKSFSIGFKMTLKRVLIDGEYAYKFFFEMYKGRDKSYSDYKMAVVVFSDEYDNITNSEYIKTTSVIKNVFLIASEGEGVERKKLWGSQNDNEEEISGKDRYEIYVDQRNMSSNEGEISDEEFYRQMNDEGKTNLVSISEAFSGEVILNNYQYGKNKDVYIGDIVTLQKKNWNVSVNARIIEVIETWDKSGKKITLKFSN